MTKIVFGVFFVSFQIFQMESSPSSSPAIFKLITKPGCDIKANISWNTGIDRIMSGEWRIMAVRSAILVTERGDFARRQKLS